jgi:hypothetical protein
MYALLAYASFKEGSDRNMLRVYSKYQKNKTYIILASILVAIKQSSIKLFAVEGRYAAQVDLFPTFRETILFPSSHVKMSWTYLTFKMEPGVNKMAVPKESYI